MQLNTALAAADLQERRTGLRFSATGRRVPDGTCSGKGVDVKNCRDGPGLPRVKDNLRLCACYSRLCTTAAAAAAATPGSVLRGRTLPERTASSQPPRLPGLHAQRSHVGQGTMAKLKINPFLGPLHLPAPPQMSAQMHSAEPANK